MASFTDKLMTFNPYIQQLPVEDMVKVGMMKQQMYEQGVQKIQSSIDNIAGLDMMRDVDRAYTQSKLSELGKTLMGVSAGDFSNSQLVNSVIGLSGKVAKDPFIRTAVESTAALKKQLSAIDEYKKQGKSNKNNEDYFYEKLVSPYLNAGLRDEEGKPISFSGKYVPYTNILEEITKNVKAAGLDETLVQQMYETDFNGKLRLDKDNNVIPARTMTEVLKSSNARQIKSIVDMTLKNGDIQSQISIDAWANTRNLKDDSVFEGFTEKFKERFALIDEQILKINGLLSGKLDEKQKEELKTDLTELKNQRTKYERDLAEAKQNFFSNPTAFKESLYRQNFENSLIEAFTSKKELIKNLDSPLIKQLNEEARLKFDKDKEAFDQRIALSKETREQQAHEANYYKDPYTGEWRKRPEDNTTGGDYTQFGAANPGKETTTAIDRNASAISQGRQDNYTSAVNFMYNIMRSQNGGKKENGEDFTLRDAEESIELWAKAKNKSKEDFANEWMLKYYNDVTEKGIKIPINDKIALEQYKNGAQILSTNLLLDKYSSEEAEKEITAADRNYINDLYEYAKPFDYTIPGTNKSITVSKQDIVDYASFIKNGDVLAKRRIESKYGDIKKFPLSISYDPALNPYYFNSWSAIKPDKTEIGDWKRSGINDIIKRMDGKLKKVTEKKEEILQKYITTDMSFSFNTNDAKMEETKQKLLAYISESTVVKDKQELQNMLNSQNTSVTFSAEAPYMEGASYKGTVIVTNDKKESIEIKNISQDDLEKISNSKFKPYVFDPYLALIKVSKYNSTNLYTDPITDRNAYQTSAISAANFNSIMDSDKYKPLGADIVKLIDGSGYIGVVHVQVKETGENENIEFRGRYKGVGDDTSDRNARLALVNDMTKITESYIDEELKQK